MALYKATIEVFLDVENEAEACDGLAETMRDHLAKYAPGSCVIEWGYAPNHSVPVPASMAELDRVSD